MAHILCKTEELGPKSFDTQLYIITDIEQDFLLSFSGFLEKKNGNLASTFDCHEAVMFTKSRASKLRTDLKREDLRRVEITSSLKKKIVDWLDAEVKITI